MARAHRKIPEYWPRGWSGSWWTLLGEIAGRCGKTAALERLLLGVMREEVEWQIREIVRLRKPRVALKARGILKVSWVFGVSR